MSGARRVITEELGGSPLSLAAQTGRLPASVFAGWPSDRDEWAAHVGEVTPLLATLRHASGSAAHGQYLDAAGAAYAAPQSIGDAYVALLRALLEPMGMVVLDSSHPAYLAAARPILLDAAHRA